MSKVTAITKLVAKPGRFEGLMQAVEAMVAAVRDEVGTEIYAVSRATREADTLFVFELFSDHSALKAHSAAGGAVGELLAPLVSDVEVVRGEPLAAKGLAI